MNILEMVARCSFKSKNLEDSLVLCHNGIEKCKLLEEDGDRHFFYIDHSSPHMKTMALQLFKDRGAQHNC